MSIYTYRYKENVQQKNPLCAASCVTKNNYPRCKFSNLMSALMYSSRLYAKSPVFEIVHEESVKVYYLDLHMYTGNIQQNSLCVESCATEEFHISPRLRLFIAMQCVARHLRASCIRRCSSVLCAPRLVRSAIGEYSVLMFGWNIRHCCLPNTNTTKRNIRHISDPPKCTVFYTPEPKLMQHTD